MKYVMILLLIGMYSGISGQEDSKQKDSSTSEITQWVYTVYTGEKEERLRNGKKEGVYLVATDGRALVGKKKQLGSLGWRSAPIFSPDGKKVAYLCGMPGNSPIPGDSSMKVQIYDLSSGKIKDYPTPDAQRLQLSYMSDGKSVVYATEDAIVVLNIEKGSTKSYPVSKVEDISVSPDNRYTVFKRREGRDRNDADGWILHLLDMTTGKVISTGRKDDGEGVASKLYWHPTLSKFLIMTFDVDEKNERSNITHSWFDVTLKRLGEVKKGDIVNMQERFPWSGVFPD